MTTEKLHNPAPMIRDLVSHASAQHLKAMGQSVWLYLYLVLGAGRLGGSQVIVPGGVAVEMGLSEQTIRSWLGQLKSHNYIRTGRDGERVRVKIIGWKAGPMKPLPTTPVSSSPSPQAQALAQALDADPQDQYWSDLVDRFSQSTIDGVLEYVKAVPDAQIRKSREALFRYLVNKRQNDE